MRLPNYLSVAALALAMLSCKKEKNKNCSLNESNFVGSYKVTTIKYKQSSSSQEIDGSSFFDACSLDDITTFNANHTYTYTDAGTKCDPAGDDSGTWALTGTSLNVDGGIVAVSNFSCSGFSIIQTDVATAGDQLTISFQKQ